MKKQTVATSGRAALWKAACEEAHAERAVVEGTRRSAWQRPCCHSSAVLSEVDAAMQATVLALDMLLASIEALQRARDAAKRTV